MRDNISWNLGTRCFAIWGRGKSFVPLYFIRMWNRGRSRRHWAIACTKHRKLLKQTSMRQSWEYLTLVGSVCDIWPGQESPHWKSKDKLRTFCCRNQQLFFTAGATRTGDVSQIFVISKTAHWGQGATLK